MRHVSISRCPQFQIIILTASCVYLCILKHWDKINLAISVVLYIYVGILFKILSVRTYFTSNYVYVYIIINFYFWDIVILFTTA